MCPDNELRLSTDQEQAPYSTDCAPSCGTNIMRGTGNYRKRGPWLNRHTHRLQHVLCRLFPSNPEGGSPVEMKSLRSASPRSWKLLFLLVFAVSTWATVLEAFGRDGNQALKQDGDGSDYGVPQPPAAYLMFGPVPGFTTAPHRATDPLLLPLLSRVPFSVGGLASTHSVSWQGLQPSNVEGSRAVFELNSPGQFTLTAVVNPGGKRLQCTIRVKRLNPRGLPFTYEIRPILPFDLSEDLSNAQTVDAYFNLSSVAQRSEIANGVFATSTNQTLVLAAKPRGQLASDGLGALLEWRLNGQAIGLGKVSFFTENWPGRHTITVGPPAAEKRLEIVAYSASLRSPYPEGKIPQGHPVTFTVQTDPPGFEPLVTWLSATKFGSAEPTLGRGPTFTTTFDNAFGAYDDRTNVWQWVGVRADNAALGQDTKQALLSAFVGPDPQAADAAYGQLFLSGADAIEPLLIVASNPGLYAGIAFHNNRSSVTLMGPPVRLIAIYLIDGILLDSPAPHYAPVLLSQVPKDPEVMLQDAVSRYQQWWSTYQGLSLDQLRRVQHPLAGSGLSWNGPILFNQAAPQNGDEKPGTNTPIKEARCLSQPDGPDADNLGDPYAWVFPPETAGGPTPYNCLAWALNCQTDRWNQPVDPRKPAMTWQTILTDYGYNVAAPVACAGMCPAGKGPKVKMVFHVPEGGTPNDSNWVHAMKQEADGDWTSKNGDDSLWENITDCAAFLDKHYPVPAGRTREVRCYCK